MFDFNPEGVAAIAQGCGVAATLGKVVYFPINPERVAAVNAQLLQPFQG